MPEAERCVAIVLQINAPRDEARSLQKDGARHGASVPMRLLPEESIEMSDEIESYEACYAIFAPTLGEQYPPPRISRILALMLWRGDRHNRHKWWDNQW
jgi:hypothetical protein